MVGRQPPRFEKEGDYSDYIEEGNMEYTYGYGYQILVLLKVHDNVCA